MVGMGLTTPPFSTPYAVDPPRSSWYLCARFARRGRASHRGGRGLRDKRYIVVEGPIGAGKTTLAKILAEEKQARVVLEKVEENPFLGRFYEDPRKYRFQAQLFFLLTRYRQQEELAQADLFNQSLVSDYLFAKDHLFAQINLDSDEFALYRQLFGLLGGRVPKPDLVVYLQARLDVLMARVRKRGKEYERSLTPEYVRRVAEAYREFFFHYEDTPLLVVNCSEIDFVEDADDTADLIREIEEMGQGVQHYIPLGSR